MDNRLLAYLHCFNHTQDYFACHEYLESLSLDSGRPAVQQGMIQAAVCLYHLYNGNIRGALRMWSRGRPRLAAAGPVWEGILIADLIQQMDAVLAAIPKAWTTQTVSPKAVASLELPTVIIHVTDKELQEEIASCTLPDLSSD